MYVRFLRINPGRQMLSGSFNPLDGDDWSQNAYSDSECGRLVVVGHDDLGLDPNEIIGPSPPFDHDATAMDVATAPEQEDLNLSDHEHDLDMLGIVEEGEAEGSIYYSDAFGSDIDLVDLESS